MVRLVIHHHLPVYHMDPVPGSFPQPVDAKWWHYVPVKGGIALPEALFSTPTTGCLLHKRVAILVTTRPLRKYMSVSLFCRLIIPLITYSAEK